jgi:O-glycosyl hydrolase
MMTGSRFTPALVLLGLLSAAPAETPPAASYVIDLAETRQVIDHFGANDAWTFQKIGAWSEENKNRIADLLYTTDKGIGLSFCRFYVGAGINRETIKDDWRTAETFEVSEGEYDWSRLANERWFLRAAKARGVRHFGMTIYSPPMRLTRNGLTNHGSDKTSSTNLKPGGEASFANYMADILAHYRSHPDEAERIEFDRIFPLNEPKWDWQKDQEGNRASNDDMRRIYLALQDAMRKRNLRTHIGGPESGSIPGMYEPDPRPQAKWHAEYGGYLRFLGDDPGLASSLGGVMTYHSYWSDRIPEELVPHREALGKALAASPDWKLWQSEYCVMERGRDLTIDTALRVARVIHCDLTLANASSWQWWLAVANENFKSGLIYTDWKKTGDAENILESKTLWALGNYSRFIRPGMRRVDMEGGPQDVNGLMASAYLDPSSGRVVAVFVNMADRPQAVRIALARGGKPTGKPLQVTRHTTSAEANLTPGQTSDATRGLEIPGRSVVTLVSF